MPGGRTAQELYADSYTLAGCAAAAHCGVFSRVPARCTGSGSGYDRCPGGASAHGNADPTLCDGAPVYQKGGAGGGGPVLLRWYHPGQGTRWYVTPDADALTHCYYHGIPDNEISSFIWTFYLESDSNPQPLGSAPTAPAYSAGGWSEYSPNGNRPIRVTAGGGR